MSDPHTRSLHALLDAWRTAVAGTNHPQPPDYRGPDALLTRLTEKTSEVLPGACFVARVRTTSDGHPYIGKALAAGAGMILAQRPAAEVGVSVPNGVVYLQVTDTAVAYAWLAAAWEQFPSRRLLTLGVTGTDGKTSTCNILYAILEAAGHPTGMTSTTRAVIGGVSEVMALHVSTPEAPQVQRYLGRMLEAGATHCVLESTSHSLAQERVTAVDYDIAVVTNITHEHLDYHGSLEAYFAAKALLFEKLTLDDWGVPRAKPHVVKTAVLNRDDSSYARLAAIATPRRLTYGLRHPADITARNIVYAPDATHYILVTPLGETAVASGLVGEFNIYNMLAAAGAAVAADVPLEAIRRGLAQVSAIDGRMERIDRGQPFTVIVDFAHTAESLEKAIGVVRGMLAGDGRIITVFGSAGKRDVEKRFHMAAVSARDAELTVLTAEDPRTDGLDVILAYMAAGAQSQAGVEGATFWRVPDRGWAIYFALTLARPQDIVLICGKGHEQSMCFETTEYPWDDRTATRAALDAFLAGRPMVDLGLPTYDPDYRLPSTP